MEHTSWVAVNREDGEIMGYLEPLDSAYDQVLPRNALGHPIGGAQDYLQGEELLLDRGIGELAETWSLDGATPPDYAILEVSVHGIVIADALLTKALAPAQRLLVAWPDTAQRLTR